MYQFRFILILCLFFAASTALGEENQIKEESYNECPECGAKYSSDVGFCGKDGARLGKIQKGLICPKCRKAGVSGEKFCREDGEKLVTIEEIIADEQKLLENKTKALEHLKEGNKYSDNKELDKALEEYEKAIVLYPDLPELQYNIGWLYGKIGAQEKAIEHLRKYCNLAPDVKNKSKAITRIVVLQGILDRKNE